MSYQEVELFTELTVYCFMACFRRDCACQGWDMNRKGASFSFGCSWSVYYNGCKFARSHIPRKFKLREESFEGVMESKFQALGQHLAPLYKQMAPMSYGAQVKFILHNVTCPIC